MHLSESHNHRRGCCLSDGVDHELDHARWTRRQFLKGLGMVSAGASLNLLGFPARAYQGDSLLSRIASLGSNRILVIVQLGGGNDGLNTVVPVGNDLYFNARPNIAIDPQTALPLSSEFGFHPELAAVHERFLEGRMAVVHGVGYPSPNLSHFISTDVWMTGHEAGDIGSTGWAGRQLDLSYPDFSESPPDAPLAVQIGSGTPFLFQGPSANMGMSLVSLDLFDQLVETGKYYGTDNLPGGPVGLEMEFVRSVANDSYRYAASIGEAAQRSSNDAYYPNGNLLADKLSVVARLIKGNLGTSIYHVSLSGFDTHANQLARHGTLMKYLAESVEAFLQDIEASGMQEAVTVMTFSEFGRRVNQNGSGGTDHGTAAPMFLFGSGVTGGFYGQHPALDDLDKAGNMKFTTDFRSVYASLLTDWFGLDAVDVSQVLGGAFATLPFVTSPTGAATDASQSPTDIELEQNYPNPFNPSTRIAFTLGRAGYVELDVFDVAGRRISRLAASVFPAGRHEIAFDAGSLSSGTYIYRLKAGDIVRSGTMTLLR